MRRLGFCFSAYLLLTFYVTPGVHAGERDQNDKKRSAYTHICQPLLIRWLTTLAEKPDGRSTNLRSGRQRQLSTNPAKPIVHLRYQLGQLLVSSYCHEAEPAL